MGQAETFCHMILFFFFIFSFFSFIYVLYIYATMRCVFLDSRIINAKKKETASTNSVVNFFRYVTLATACPQRTEFAKTNMYNRAA